MGNAISACFKKYATFTGRASRSEYWFFTLFYVIVYFLFSLMETATGIVGLSYVPYVAMFIPSLSVSVRRMHDTDRSGWFILVPIYNLVLLCTASTPGSNKHGDL